MMNIIVWIPASSCFYDGVKEKLMGHIHVINIPACLEFTSIIKSRPDSVYLDCLSLLSISRKDSFWRVGLANYFLYPVRKHPCCSPLCSYGLFGMDDSCLPSLFSSFAKEDSLVFKAWALSSIRHKGSTIRTCSHTWSPLMYRKCNRAFLLPTTPVLHILYRMVHSKLYRLLCLRSLKLITHGHTLNILLL